MRASAFNVIYERCRFCFRSVFAIAFNVWNGPVCSDEHGSESRVSHRVINWVCSLLCAVSASFFIVFTDIGTLLTCSLRKVRRFLSQRVWQPCLSAGNITAMLSREQWLYAVTTAVLTSVLTADNQNSTIRIGYVMDQISSPYRAGAISLSIQQAQNSGLLPNHTFRWD